jgi:pSer/pThr/pTyr-binding forkhead associated (FHA) protein
MTDTRYALVLVDEPGERFPLAGSVTVGRHLENDLVIAGEDVRDFHVRIEVTERGPRVIVLEGATAHVDEAPIDGVVGMCPGAELILGQHRLRLEVESSTAACGWKLHRVGDADGVVVTDTLDVGRATDCDLQLVEGHVSRRHAQLRRVNGTLWVEDLRSANGTFVNGDRVAGAWRIFHGDEIAFDTMRYQLIGDAPDLTPIRPPGQPPDQLEVSERIVDAPRAETAEVAHATIEAGTIPTPAPVPAAPLPSGPVLIGRSRPVSGRTFALAFGRHLIGRGPEADIHIAEASVSLRHAELELRPDGAQLVNLISTNGTWVNGAEIHTTRLSSGDSIRIGRVTLEYREPHASQSGVSRRGRWALGAAFVVVAAVIVVALYWLA